jgi:peptidoglycan/xylan/chitin deacetylase (PgdA/CDA1 family)
MRAVSWARAAACCCGLAWLQPAARLRADLHKPVYLTLDTGHMGVAPLIAEVLNRQQVKVTFFAANETHAGRRRQPGRRTGRRGGRRGPPKATSSLRTPGTTSTGAPTCPAAPAMRFQHAALGGPGKGKDLTWTAAQYCAEISQSAKRLEEITGKKTLPLFRAPGGKTSPALLAAAKACGYEHVGWSPAGFLGDELPSEKYPNAQLLKKALRDIRPATSCWPTWASGRARTPGRRQGAGAADHRPEGARLLLCKTLREHPQYKDWIEAQPGPAPAKPAK